MEPSMDNDAVDRVNTDCDVALGECFKEGINKEASWRSFLFGGDNDDGLRSRDAFIDNRFEENVNRFAAVDSLLLLSLLSRRNRNRPFFFIVKLFRKFLSLLAFYCMRKCLVGETETTKPHSLECVVSPNSYVPPSTNPQVDNSKQTSRKSSQSALKFPLIIDRPLTSKIWRSLLLFIK